MLTRTGCIRKNGSAFGFGRHVISAALEDMFADIYIDIVEFR